MMKMLNRMKNAKIQDKQDEDFQLNFYYFFKVVISQVTYEFTFHISSHLLLER